MGSVAPATAKKPPDLAEAQLLALDKLVVRLRTEDGLPTAVDGVPFSVAKGEVLGVFGESGCGKSVTAQA